MKIFLDTADLTMISSPYQTGLIDGVTTNPTLILRSGQSLQEVIASIANNLPNIESVSAEVVADTAEEMLAQADSYLKLSSNSSITIKVPCTVEGLIACRGLSDRGVKTNVTLIFSVSQAILAAKAGATYISPFVGRWIDNSVDGVDLIKRIRQVFDRMGTDTQILAASIREVRQVEQCAMYGADVVTIPPTVFWGMYKNILTDKGLELFQKDWEEANK